MAMLIGASTSSVPKSHLELEAIQTLMPIKVTYPQSTIHIQVKNVATSSVFNRRVHVVLYYNKSSDGDSGYFVAGWLKESLGIALSDEPLLVGRVRRDESELEGFEIVSNDGGVRLVEARISRNLVDFVGMRGKGKEEGDLVYWEDAGDGNLEFCPLLCVQALCMIPRNSLHYQTSNLGFSTSVSRSSSAINSFRLSCSRVSLNRFSLSSKSRTENSRSGSLVVRAEAEVEAETAEQGEADEVADGEAPEVDADADVEEKPVFTPRVKLGDVMGILNKRAIEASDKERPTPDLRAGDVVQIKLEVPENKRRLSIYKGIVISKQNAGIHTTIRIRRIIAGIGVEIVFPVYSPNIKEIRVVSHRKVRRARLYYLRDKLPRLSTFK